MPDPPDRRARDLPAAFFVPDGGGFVATAHTRGPWSADHQHAGPPAALLGRAIEQAVADDPALAVARMTIELLSPVPIAAVEVRTAVLRAGRQVRRIDATLAADGRIVCRATGLCVRTGSLQLPPVSAGADDPVPGPERCGPLHLPWFTWDVGYHTAVEVRLARGELGRGPAAAWLRPRVALIAGETPSPLQRVLIAADSGNGIAVVLDPREFTFINADLTVGLHRAPEGEWIGLDAATFPGERGIGLTVTRLLDARGPIGRALQTLVVARRGP